MEPLTLPNPDPDLPSLNYEVLRAEGLSYIERLSPRLWTDFNIHDPGITTLEILCFAITELGYRATFPIEDLLTRPDKPYAPPEPPLFAADAVFPGRPVTTNDLRKLLVDLEGVNNAWFEPVQSVYFLDCSRSRLSLAEPEGATGKGQFSLKGVYDVLLEVDASVDTASPEAMAPLMDSVRRRLHANRNLCTDFERIDIVPRKPFKLCADIELAPEADAEQVEAAILLAVQANLTPPVPFFSLEQMLAAGRSLEEIWSGPRLDHGFIDGASLTASELKQELRLSDILRVILQVPGVLAVREILMLPVGQRILPKDADKWIIPVRDSAGPPVQPVLSAADSVLRFFRDQVPAPTDFSNVARIMTELRAEAQSRAVHLPEQPRPRLGGKVRDLAGYSSIRHHFPATYGIGSTGLPPSATAARKAYARQFQAYLLFFDQILADFFAQLAHVRDLFSLDETVDRTYFTQTVEEAASQAGVYVAPEAIADTVQQLSETPGRFFERRNQFLDHLLARFAESFSDYAWTMYVVDQGHAPAEAAEAKRRFLTDFPRLSRDRGGAFDLMRRDALWDTDNVSGLGRRLAALLGIRDYRRRNLSEIRLDVYEERDTDEIHEYRFRIKDDSPGAGGKILLSGSWKHFDPGSAMAAMRTALAAAMQREHYSLKETRDGRFYFNVVDASGDIVARRIEYFTTPEARDAAINYLINLLHERYSDEGFFILEHILLRLPAETRAALEAPEADPAAAGSLLLPVCVKPDCADSAYIDPYSHRISVILPAWSRRFEQTAFRGFAEDTIRRETPAHLLPKICWIDQQQMREFEQVWQRWLQVAFGSGRGSRDKALRELVTVLSRLRSVYPSAEMTPCETIDREHPPFLLGQTIMGEHGG